MPSSTSNNSTSTTSSPSLNFPRITEQHIRNCSFSSWYENFKRVTLKSKIIKPLPEEFIKYLHADSVYLPDRKYVGLANS